MPCLSDVISRYVKLYPKGSGMTGLCPFHSDQRMGNFIVNDHKNVWKCFACNTSSNRKEDPKVTFISMLKNISKEEAVSTLAADFGEEAEKLNMPQASQQNRKTQEFDSILLDAVYSTVHKYAGLRKKDRIYLRSRNINDFSDYFSFPIYPDAQARIFKSINNLLTDEFLVPGFAYNHYEDKWCISKFNGIGILIRNALGQVTGIQIKTDKYIWFASSKESEDACYSNACSNIAPVEVIYPKKLRKSYTIVITEGHFKAKKLAGEGYIALSIAGVSHWWKVKKMLRQVAQFYNISEVYIAFDADYRDKTGVLENLIHLCNDIRHLHETYVIIWDGTYGKGIDDLINENENYLKYITKVKSAHFLNEYKSKKAA